VAEKKNSTPSSIVSSSGYLCHIKDEIFEDAASNDVVDDTIEDVTNDTNEDDLLYFACVTNHYLHLAKASKPPSIVSRNEMKYPIIVDSGANGHMFKEHEFFDTLLPASGRVNLGDGKTVLDIKGIGTVQCKIF
jgi:hypothetical protein